MATYLSGLSIPELQKRLAAGTGAPAQPFAWDSKYLPLIIGVAGVGTVFVIAGIVKRKKKGRKK